jgi:hypothetical protein
VYLTFTSSKDTYITNKFINSSVRATDANVGVASTLDLFKLYDENTARTSTAASATIKIVNDTAGGGSGIDDGSPPSITLISTDGTSRTYSFQNGGSYANGALVSGTTVRWYGTDASSGHSQGDFAGYLKSAIEGTAGHNGKLTVVLSTDTNTNDTLTITQATRGSSGNKAITVANGDTDDIVVSSAFVSGTDPTDPIIENSRALIYFNLADISASLKDKVSFDYFTASLKLHDVQGNNIAPKNFTLTVFPLAKSWNEGTGRDVYTFSHLDRANWVTRSYTNSTNNLWAITGAKAEGALGSTDIDIIGSGSIGGGSTQFLYSTQYFSDGNEDLKVDVSTVISASMTGFIDNHGFLIAFSGSQETDEQTYFVKRFLSRHTKNPFKVPKLIFEWEDHVQDRHKALNFNNSGSLFLNNFIGGSPANLVSGSSLTQITGSNSILVKLHTGSWSKYFTGSQHTIAGLFKPGKYSAAIAVDSFASASVNSEDTLSDFINASGSVTFGEEWLSLDNTVSFFTGTLEIKKSPAMVNSSYRDIRFTVIDLKSEYKQRGDAKIRLFVRDTNESQDPVRIPIKLPSIVLEEVYYRIKDANTKAVIVPFGQTNNSTRVSSDADGMFFNLPLSILPKNRIYTVELLVVDRGNESIFETGCRFKVVS